MGKLLAVVEGGFDANGMLRNFTTYIQDQQDAHIQELCSLTSLILNWKNKVSQFPEQNFV